MRRRLTYLRPKHARINEKPRRLAGLELAGVAGARLPDQERESSDNPMLNAFCRVAPSDRFSFLAIFAAGAFLRAIVFSSRTCTDVQARLFFPFFISISVYERWSF